MRYEAVALPSGAADATPDEILAGVHGWLSSRPMLDLVRAFGGRLPAAQTSMLVRWLVEFSTANWDFRTRDRVGERHHVADREFTPETDELVQAVAASLGLERPVAPAHRSYDHVLVLGGRLPACLRRMDYVGRLIRDGVTAARVAALGSFRTLDERERSFIGEPAEYEIDGFKTAARRVFGVGQPAHRRRWGDPAAPGSWLADSYVADSGTPVDLLAAPAATGRRRANTADTYAFWERVVAPAAAQRVLVVTSRLYVPFQHCEAVRVLHARGCTLETVGCPPAVDAYGCGIPATGRYLQEINSAIRAMRKLVTAFCYGQDDDIDLDSVRDGIDLSGPEG